MINAQYRPQNEIRSVTGFQSESARGTLTEHFMANAKTLISCSNVSELARMA